MTLPDTEMGERHLTPTHKNHTETIFKTYHMCSGITGGGQGAECPPETSDWEISADLPGK